MDNGTWTIVVGVENWTFGLDTTKLAKGHHHIEAKAFAANLSSETASVNFTVNNPEPRVSSGGNQWCLPAIIIVVASACAAVILLLRKMKGN
jgi:hypothetical protein